ncbi:MAG TPA: Flp family type IVb pilin [Sphingomicrobium sp.]|nr:Flp family type IVb pilin [Sphingomicrobium sp.]
MIAIREHLRALAKNERGATAIEYGLICALIVIAMIAGLQLLAGGSGSMWGRILTAAETYMA